MEIQIRNSFPRWPPLFPGIRFPPPSASSPFIPNFSGPKPLQKLNVRNFLFGRCRFAASQCFSRGLFTSCVWIPRILNTHIYIHPYSSRIIGPFTIFSYPKPPQYPLSRSTRPLPSPRPYFYALNTLPCSSSSSSYPVYRSENISQPCFSRQGQSD